MLSFKKTLVVCAITALILVALAFIGNPTTTTTGPLADPIDFMAFYCGGKIIDRGVDPYRVEPLRSCEAAAMMQSRVTMQPGLVVPSPLPPYALAIFKLVCWMPFRTACVVFLFLSIAAVATSIGIVARLTWRRPFLVAAPLMASTFGASLPIGQVIPIVLAAMCACALAVRHDRRFLAMVGLGITMIEPHIGLPIGLAMFLFLPKMRVPILALALLLVGITFCVASPRIVAEYLLVALPAHAFSEVTNIGAQYSATSLAWAFGAKPDVAILIGKSSYASMLIFGIFVARRLALRTCDPSFYILVPPTLVLIGGLYAHIQLMAIGLPCALVLIGYSRGLTKVAMVITTSLLAFPWQSFFEDYLWQFYPHRTIIDPGAALAAVSSAGALADRVWGVWIIAVSPRDYRTFPEMLAYKAPTWLALVTVGWYAYRLGRAPTGTYFDRSSGTR